MTFPATARNVLVEMYRNGIGWWNITGDVYTREDIVVTRGRSDEASQSQPTSCPLVLNNADGKYSPRNPVGAFYGTFGRNTEIRVAIQVDPVYDAYSQTSATGDLSWVHTPVGQPTGVCLILWEFNVAGSTVGDGEVLYGGVAMERKAFLSGTVGAVNVVKHVWWLNRNIPTGPQTVTVDGNVAILRQASVMTVTGGSNAEIDATASVSGSGINPTTTMTTTKRAIIFESLFTDLDDGSTITPSVGYTQLGEHDLGTETVAVAKTNVLDPALYAVAWFAATSGWSIVAVAVRAVYYRFWGEVSSWPANWDTTGNDAWVDIQCAGLSRRLGQGVDPAETGLRNFIFPAHGLFRYWPLSGAKGTQYSLDIAPVWGSPQNYRFYSEGGSFVYGEEMGSSYLGTGMAYFNSNSGTLRGDVGTGYSNWALDFVYQTLALGDFFVTCYDYHGFVWTLELDGNTGVAQVSVTDPVLGPIGFSPTGQLGALLDDQPHHVRLKLLRNGVDTDWSLYIDGVLVDSGTYAGYNADGLAWFQMAYDRTSTQSWVNIAHIALWADLTSESWPSAAEVSQAAQGYLGEEAGTRVQRISELAGYDLAVIGDAADTAPMGPQYSEGFLAQLRDAESTDLGDLAEPRDALGLQYRTHRSLYNQAPAFTLSYQDGQVAGPLGLVDDDMLTRNDVTAVRRDGDSFRVTQDTGPLSIAAPPTGVGRYKDEVTVNVETDGFLAGVASWLLHRGTVDESRLPALKVNLHNKNVVAAGLEPAILAADLGDLVVVGELSAASLYDDLSLLVLGYVERINEHTHEITFNCAPGSPYDVAVYGTAKYDTDGSELVAGINSSATSFQVQQTGTSLWTTDPAAFPFDIRIGGERMTVTNITNATSPQTFTVTRAVNGVVKSHLASAAVRLWSTPRYAL